MDIYREYATDDTKENAGVWKDVGDASFLVARGGNRAYSEMLTSLVEANQRLLDLPTPESKKLSEEIMIGVTAKTILLGWKGNVAFKGAALSYSVDNAKLLLGVKDFRTLIGQFSSDFNSYRVEQEATDAKNS
jgi:hypothetical protein